MPNYLLIEKICKKDEVKKPKTFIPCSECGRNYKFQLTIVRIDTNNCSRQNTVNVCIDHIEGYIRNYQPISIKYFNRLQKKFNRQKLLHKSQIP